MSATPMLPAAGCYNIKKNVAGCTVSGQITVHQSDKAVLDIKVLGSGFMCAWAGVEGTIIDCRDIPFTVNNLHNGKHNTLEPALAGPNETDNEELLQLNKGPPCLFHALKKYNIHSANVTVDSAKQLTFSVGSNGPVHGSMSALVTPCSDSRVIAKEFNNDGMSRTRQCSTLHAKWANASECIGMEGWEIMLIVGLIVLALIAISFMLHYWNMNRNRKLTSTTRTPDVHNAYTTHKHDKRNGSV